MVVLWFPTNPPFPSWWKQAVFQIPLLSDIDNTSRELLFHPPLNKKQKVLWLTYHSSVNGTEPGADFFISHLVKASGVLIPLPG